MVLAQLLFSLAVGCCSEPLVDYLFPSSSRFMTVVEPEVLKSTSKKFAVEVFIEGLSAKFLFWH
jgi:hypothetical protein